MFFLTFFFHSGLALLMTDFPKLQSAKKEQGLCQKNMSNHRTKISSESNNWMLNHAKKIILRY